MPRWSRPDAGACVPRPELCNDRDDDCDGDIDEDFRTLGTPCTVGRGICEASGTVVCFNNLATCNVEPGPAGVEVCNALDDNCDGRVDEAFAELGQPCEVGDGICFNAGDYVCRNNEMVCTADPLPGEVETCNGLDDDCDGLVDQGFGLGDACTLGLGECAADGNVTCDGLGGATCRAFPGVPSLETCNGLDDDCDGDVDNGFEGLGLPCRAGLGICEAIGTVICNAAGDGFACDAATGQPRAETCNGLDDDCSGAADDFEPQLPENCGVCGVACELPHAAPTCRNSVCAVLRCQPGFIDLDGDTDNGCESSCSPTNPPDERCDGIDNDCDGAVDGPDVCAGDAFSFCRSRQSLAPPHFCHDFTAGSLDADWWDFSIGRIGVVPGVIRGRAYAGGVPAGLAAGGGHTTRVKIFGPQMRLAYHLRFLGSHIGAGVFNGTLRPNNDANSTGTGFTFEALNDAGDPVLRVLEHPAMVERARAAAPDLTDGLIHYVSATRDLAGHWRLQLDGAPLVLDVDAPNVGLTEFTRVTVFADAAANGSTLDDLTVELDADADGRYPPSDDCPDVGNPDTVDADDNGRGVACDDRDADEVEDALDDCPGLNLPAAGDADGDGTDDACDGDGAALLFGMGAPSARSPWLMRLEDGVRWRSFRAAGPTEHVVARPDGRVAYTGDRSIGVAAADGSGAAPVILQADTPEWLADGRLMYHGGDGNVYAAAADGSNPVQLFSPDAGRRLRVRVARGGTVFLIIRYAGADADLEVRALGGQVLVPPIPIPAGGATPPFVDLHPVDNRLLIAGLEGDATGVSLVDPVRFLVTPLDDTPAVAALFTPKGNAAVAMESLPAGRRLVGFGLVPGGPVTEFAPVNPDLGDHLAWAPADRIPPPVDADRDGLHDDTDACPTHPWEPVPGYQDFDACHGADGSAGDLRMSWDGTDWRAGAKGMCSRLYNYVQHFDARGGYRGRVYTGYSEDNAPWGAPSIVWNGRGHTISTAGDVNGNARQFLYTLADNDLLGALAVGVDILPGFGGGEAWYRGTLLRKGPNVLWSGHGLRLRTYDRARVLGASVVNLGGNNPSFVDAAPAPNNGTLTVSSENRVGLYSLLVDENLGPVGVRSVMTGTWVQSHRVEPTPAGYVVVWLDAGQIWARALNAAGVPVGANVRISTGFEPAARPDLTVAEGTVLISWPQQTAGNDRVYLRAYNPDLTPRGAAFSIGPPQQEIQAASLAADDSGRVAVGWMEERTGQNPRNHNWLSVGRFQCREP